MNASPCLQAKAAAIVDDLVAAGAVFDYRPPTTASGPSFTYELRAGGNRQRCRSLIASAKGQPLVWAELLNEIALRSKEAL